MDKLNKVLKIFNDSNLTELEYEEESFKIKLTRNLVTQAPATAQLIDIVEPTKPIKLNNSVKSPLVGTYYASNEPNANPFVKVGDKVKKGDVLCIIEAMKVMNEICANKDGFVEKILVEDGSMVQFDQDLILIGE